jgi:uncharacterized OsmC-like protein
MREGHPLRRRRSSRTKHITVTIPKRWSVNALSAGQTALQIFVDGQPLTQSSPGVVDNVSPVEFLLISAATCFALSVRAVLLARKLPGTAFEVVVTGEKASDAPSRLNRIAIAVIFGDGLDESRANAIADDAKSLCTVTNTILGDAVISVAGRTGRNRQANPL